MAEHAIDTWHDHSADAPPQSAHTERVNPLALLVIFVSLTLFVAVFVGLTVVYYNSSVATVKAKKLETTTGYDNDYAPYRAQQDAYLNEYAWVDAEAGTVRIPVERAMELVVQGQTQSQQQQ